MILHRLSAAGLYAFPKPVSVPFEDLPPLISLLGPNGAGKTTLLDGITAALYGVMPFRPGSLSRNFTSTGYIELEWESDGERYLSRINVDPATERTEATLSDVSGTVLGGPLIRDFRRAIAERIPPLDLWLASGYAAQNRVGAFLYSARADRRALLTDMLGLQRYPRYEERAKQRGDEVERELAALRARTADLRIRAAARVALEVQRAELEAKRDDAQHRLDAANAALTAAAARLSTTREAVAALTPLKSTAIALTKAIAELATRIDDAERRRTKNEEVRGRASEIHAAETKAAELRRTITDLDGEISRARKTHLAAVTALQEATRERVRVTGVLVAAEQRERSLSRQTEILTTVPCGGQAPYAGCQFLKDARAATEALPGVTAEVTAARAALDSEPAAVTPADPVPALEASKKRLQTDLAALGDVLALSAPLAAAQSRLEELDGILRQAREDHDHKATEYEATSIELDRLPFLEDEVRTAQQAENEAAQQRRYAQQDVTAVAHELGGIESQFQTAAAAEDEAERLEAQLGPLVDDVADWDLLAKAFGSAGIPALLIDQALPEIGRLATELLRECFGESVFSIALTTQRENAAGDRLLETLDVVVSRGAEPLDAALLSGGESVLVSEALSLALALYNATRSGRRFQTLLRDEVSAPLDIDRAPAYARMLRRAVALGGFRHVVFVSHQPACHELADARIVVQGGAVKVA